MLHEIYIFRMTSRPRDLVGDMICVMFPVHRFEALLARYNNQRIIYTAANWWDSVGNAQNDRLDDIALCSRKAMWCLTLVIFTAYMHSKNQTKNFSFCLVFCTLFIRNIRKKAYFLLNLTDRFFLSVRVTAHAAGLRLLRTIQRTDMYDWFEDVDSRQYVTVTNSLADAAAAACSCTEHWSPNVSRLLYSPQKLCI
jgi:hypothetical protein